MAETTIGYYDVALTLDASDDMDRLIDGLTRRQALATLQALESTVERIRLVPHLSRMHATGVRVTALGDLPYRLWYCIDEAGRTIVIIALTTLTHSQPTNGQPPGRWTKIWWKDMPHLPARLPDPYPEDSWAAQPDWEDDATWLARVEAEIQAESQKRGG